ncbi:MAG: TIGR03862 family flavoprotein [Pseudomonadota bacterium]|nr:TIGR03862 family flavoprotein [Pseudomonadota bacterium]
MQDRKVAIIGAGAAGLMAAEVLSQAGVAVDVYEHKPSAARKILMAGKGGLNITHSEDIAAFIQRYDQPEWLQPMLMAFSPDAIVAWMAALGIQSYVGTSGRVFPAEMKAAPLVRAWLARLKRDGVQFFHRHHWLGWDQASQQVFQRADGSQFAQRYAATILAVGGGSWARLGSDGQALTWLVQQGVSVQPLQASNCGVQVAWSPFVQALAGQPLKRVRAWLAGIEPVLSDAMLTGYGLEGGVLYALSRPIRQQLNAHGTAQIFLDLLPNLDQAQLQERLHAKAKQSQTNLWRKAGLDPVKSALIREGLPKSAWSDPAQVAALSKQLSIKVNALQPIDEAISTAGGVARLALDRHLMLTQQTGVFCCGEMLDWDAPTGGYLLTACFASGRWAGQGVLGYLAELS